ALVIQSNQFEALATVTVLPVTSTLIDAPLFRILLEPSDTNQLFKKSQIMVDKVMSLKLDKIGNTFGEVDENVLLEVSRSLAVFLGIAN
ncbi:MAG: type II toxin-antitoxin system PemK/MazF family toxin, partial [Desulfuromusa sp.]